MTRFTFFEDGHWWIRLNGVVYGDFPEVDRLAAYEDTGLEPEEVLTAKEVAEVACALNLLKEYQSVGSVEHFRELSRSEHDGRLVVLPSNDPLTIEELRNMTGQPVYLKTLGEDFDDGWYIVGGIDKVRLHCLYLYSLLWLEHYGKTWLAYRRKPEKGEEHGKQS